MFEALAVKLGEADAVGVVADEEVKHGPHEGEAERWSSARRPRDRGIGEAVARLTAACEARRCKWTYTKRSVASEARVPQVLAIDQAGRAVWTVRAVVAVVFRGVLRR
jgi:hypothetical protein